MVYPEAGVAVSTGTAWGTSLPLAGMGPAIVTGPSSSVSGHLVEFVGTAGQIADGGAPPVGAIVGTTDTQTLSNKTLSAPTLVGFTDSAASTISAAGALSTPALAFTGAPIITGGTGTTTKPLVLLEPTGATSTGWSTTGTMLGVNSLTGFTGSLLDLQINGVSKFLVNSTNISTNLPYSSNTTVTSTNLKANESNVAFSTTPAFTAIVQSSIITLTANLTSWTIATGNGGQSMTLTFCQNATGGFTTGTTPANVVGFFPGGISLAPSTCSSQAFTYSTNQVKWIANNSIPAMFNSAALTGTPTAPTASTGTSTTQIASTAFVANQIAASGYSLGGTLSNGNAVIGTGSGTGGTATLTGLDGSHILTVTTGTTPALSSTVATVTFTASRGHTSYCSMTPANSAAALLTGATMVFMGSNSATSYVITSGTTALSITATTYAWNVSCP
jgi:hypothetical protein